MEMQPGVKGLVVPEQQTVPPAETTVNAPGVPATAGPVPSQEAVLSRMVESVVVTGIA